jgi:hypothetical protein
MENESLPVQEFDFVEGEPPYRAYEDLERNVYSNSTYQSILEEERKRAKAEEERKRKEAQAKKKKEQEKKSSSKKN